MKQIKEVRQVLNKKLSSFKRLKAKTEKSLAKAPEGKLVISSSHGVVQYYHKTDDQKKRSYIDRSKESLIASLAQKDYDLALQKEISKQEKQIQKVLKELPQMEIEEVYSALHEGRKQFVNPHFMTDEQYIDQWLNVKYTGKQFKDNMPLHLTERGEKVRSKSEKIIADKLWVMGIPYRYEFPVYLKGFGTVYPDFTLLNIKTKEEVYVEHFGMMDDPEYCEKAIFKIHEYARNGIVMGKNLLLTFETKNAPLDMNVVEKMFMKLQ